jgi:ferrochelatase
MTDQQTAVLLLAHGTPDVLGEMAEYLKFVTSGRALPQAVVEELQHRYAEIGLRETPGEVPPPLTRWTVIQASMLEASYPWYAPEDPRQPRVYVGMRNWHPFIADVLAEMRRDGITRCKAICLAPQNSRTSVGLYRRAVLAAAAPTQTEPAVEVEFVAGWAASPLLSLAFAERLWPVWAEACAIQKRRVPVLFTAHSVPCRTILAGTANAPIRQDATAPADGIQAYDARVEPDPYPVECKSTAAAVAARMARLGMTERDWYFAFQSQGVAGAPWIGPSVEDTLKALAAEGHKGVVLQPIGFLCDHVEILYDIDIAFRQTARALGMELWRAESLNDSATLIRALVDVATGHFLADVDELPAGEERAASSAVQTQSAPALI